MKKILLLLSVFVMFGVVAEAKNKKKKGTDSTSSEQPAQISSNGPAATPATTLKADDIAFTDMIHDFGTVLEGPDATCKFTFVNKGNEPLVIQKAQASCGCTVPTYSKDPIAPGATGTIDVAFHTSGKPAGNFNKTITVTSNAGVKVLNIKGVVEKAPATSVPETTSLIKTN